MMSCLSNWGKEGRKEAREKVRTEALFSRWYRYSDKIKAGTHTNGLKQKGNKITPSKRFPLGIMSFTLTTSPFLSTGRTRETVCRLGRIRTPSVQPSNSATTFLSLMAPPCSKPTWHSFIRRVRSRVLDFLCVMVLHEERAARESTRAAAAAAYPRTHTRDCRVRSERGFPSRNLATECPARTVECGAAHIPQSVGRADGRTDRPS